MRSNGTVTYVGKDIAYHLWKFGLLGRDFGYKPFFEYRDRECWISTDAGSRATSALRRRKRDLQRDRRAAERSAGKSRSRLCAAWATSTRRITAFTSAMRRWRSHRAAPSTSDYEVAQEDLDSPYILVSGRKGFGVKADDLIDKLIAATRAEVDARQTGRDEAERQRIAEQIAIGALRYFMLKFTRNSVIAFDFKDALSFEGRDRTLRAVRGGAHPQHLPQGEHDAGSGAGRICAATPAAAFRTI